MCIKCSFTNTPLSCEWLTEVVGWASVGTLPRERLCLADELLNWPSLGHLPDPLSLSLCSPAPYKQLSLPGPTTCLLNRQSTPAGSIASSGQQTPDARPGCFVTNMDLKQSYFWLSDWGQLSMALCAPLINDDYNYLMLVKYLCSMCSCTTPLSHLSSGCVPYRVLLH